MSADVRRRKGMSFGRIATLLALLGAIALLVLFGYRLVGSGSGSALQGPGRVNTLGRAAAFEPKPAPDFALTTFGGEELSLSDYRGEVVILNFWASWCDPCKREAPVLERVSRRYRDRGVVFLGVNTWDEEGDARAFLEEYGVTYPNGTREQLAIEYGLLGIPETFVVDPEGMIVNRWFGPLEDGQLAELIDAGLAPR